MNRLAFGRDDEARLVDALRDGGYVKVSIVVEANGQAIGHILFSDLPVVTPHGTIKTLALAPLAVVPERQREGLGSMLVREGLRACRQAGHRIIVVLGHPEFYPRFGFSATMAERLRSPFSGPAFMAIELVPGALEGVEGEVRYPPPFSVSRSWVESPMSQDHVGYLDLDGRITRFREARCCFGEGQLDVEAEGSKCRLKLYGIPFPEARGVADLPGTAFGPDTETVLDDPIAEGGIETRRMWLSYRSLTVGCRAYDPASGTIIVSFGGRVVDVESGFNCAVEGKVRCRVVESLW